MPPAPLLEPGARVDHYEIVRFLARGGHGEVYLARDDRLGRRVALKLLSARDGAAGAFLAEARATAVFSHPHIVAIFGAGEHDGRPYLALEYLEGQTLRERLDDGRPGPREAQRLGLAIAEALAEAHRHNLLHLDLKPENIIIPRDGRLRVLDFGLARLGERLTTEDAVRGTPAYMAPEQWRGEPLGGAADVWALGVLLHELGAGVRPWAGATVGELRARVSGDDPAPVAGLDLPAEMREVVARCLRKPPGERPPAAEVAALLGSSLGEGVHAARADSPYRGLRPFGERDADVFFGREVEIAACLERLREQPLLPIVGVSGAGKTSFVRAGLVPRLREQGAWVVYTVRPGAYPVRALREALAAGPGGGGGSTSASGSTAAATITGPPAETVTPAAEPELAVPALLGQVLRRRAARQHTRVLLYVDQLEEAVTLCAADAERAAFLEALCLAADDPRGPVRVVVSLREDFISRLADVGPLRDALGASYVLRRPEAEALRQILVRPLARVGYAFDDQALPDDIVAAVRGEPAALPVVQFALDQLWERRDLERHVLLRSAYERMGGVAGALAAHADATIGGLDEPRRDLARSLLLRLVTPERTRRTLTRAAALEGLGEAAAEVLDRLVVARLVTVRKGAAAAELARIIHEPTEHERRDASSRRSEEGAYSPSVTDERRLGPCRRQGASEASRNDAPQIGGQATEAHGLSGLELAHESLVQAWPALARWLDEGRDELALLAEARQAAELWDRRGRREDEVWRGEALADARRRLARLADAPPPLVAAFLEAGARVATRGRRRRRAALAAAAVALVALAVASLAVALIVADKRRLAEERGAEAVRRRAEAQREDAKGALARGAVLEARANLRLALETEDSLLARGLWSRLARDPLAWRLDSSTATLIGSFSPDGAQLAIGCEPSICLIDVATQAVRRVRDLEGMSRAFRVLWAGADRLVVSGVGGEVAILDLRGGGARELWGGGHYGARVAVDRAGRWLAAQTREHDLGLWDLARGELVATLRGHADEVIALTFSGDGGTLASAARDGTVRLWAIPSGAAAGLIRPDSDLGALAFAPDGATLAVGAGSGAVVLYDRGGAERGRLVGHDGMVRAVAYVPDGARLVSGSTDGPLIVWDLARGREERRLLGHQSNINMVAWSPDGVHVASTAMDSRVLLWDLRARDLGRPSFAGDPGGGGMTAIFSPDGREVLVGGGDRVRVWDAAAGRMTRSLRGHADMIVDVAQTRGGEALVTASYDGTARLWETTTGRERARFGKLLGEPIEAADITAGGDRVVTAGRSGEIVLWDAVGGAALARVRPFATASVARFLPDGRVLAACISAPRIEVWDAALARKLKEVPLPEPIADLVVAPDGQVATAAADGTVRLWDAALATQRRLGSHGSMIYRLAISADARQVATGGDNGRVVIWNVGDGSARTLLGHREPIGGVGFSPDGTILASASADSTLRLWETATGRPRFRAPLLGVDGLLASQRGWERVVDGAAVTPPAASWRAAVLERARRAAMSEDGATVCLATAGGGAELWSASKDRALATAAGDAEIDELVAGPGACLVRRGGAVDLLGTTGSKRLPEEASALGALRGGGWLVASAASVKWLSPDGLPLRAAPGGRGVTAVTAAGDGAFLGFRDGGVERVASGGAPVSLALERAPNAAVARLVIGPRGSLVVGFADGVVGVWDAATGAQLDAGRLHGAALHVVLWKDKLLAASELADDLVLDLAALDADRCDLLRQVWSRVPAVWEGGQAVVRPPPADHPCR